MDKNLDEGVIVNWVRGPFSKEPTLPKQSRLNWNLHHAPDCLDELIVNCDYALTVFGISFFELLQYGIPTVVFSPYSDKSNKDLEALKNEEVALVADNYKSGTKKLFDLMNDNKLAKKCSSNSLQKMSVNGTESLAKEIYSLVGAI